MPELKDARYKYRKKEEIVRYMLMECLCFKEIKKTM